MAVFKAVLVAYFIACWILFGSSAQEIITNNTSSSLPTDDSIFATAKNCTAHEDCSLGEFCTITKRCNRCGNYGPGPDYAPFDGVVPKWCYITLGGRCAPGHFSETHKWTDGLATYLCQSCSDPDAVRISFDVDATSCFCESSNDFPVGTFCTTDLDYAGPDGTDGTALADVFLEGTCSVCTSRPASSLGNSRIGCDEDVLLPGLGCDEICARRTCSSSD